jgi:alkanesulfonate monooxygenase SsuD/methylene tetrahydromethanopterin reductase-like flavin-dependent oxidoreductase (luciferase family)
VIVTGIVNHPAPFIAKMAATIDHVSNGRLELGLGAGSMADELASYGISLGSVQDRMDRWEEALQVIVSLFTHDEVTFEGRHYVLRAAHCEPKPIQKPYPPICIGTRAEQRGLRVAARWAQHWNFQGAASAGPAEFSRKSAVLAARCEEIGRDPDEILRSVVIPFEATSESSRLEEAVVAYDAAGADLFIVGLLPPYDAPRLERIAELLRVMRPRC